MSREGEVSEQVREIEQFTQWGVESPDGYVWTYSDPVIARIVSREQRKPVLRRTVAQTPWENDPENDTGMSIPPEERTPTRPEPTS